MRLRDFFENRPRQEEALEVAAAEQEATREALVATEMRLLAMEEILERRESELVESAEAMETMQVGVEFRRLSDELFRTGRENTSIVGAQQCVLRGEPLGTADGVQN